VVTSAVKQSLKAYHPVLNEPVNLSQLLAKPFEGRKLIAHCEKPAKPI